MTRHLSKGFKAVCDNHDCAYDEIVYYENDKAVRAQQDLNYDGQIDTWDPKRRGDPEKKVAGSAYDSIPTAIDGAGDIEWERAAAPSREFHPTR